MIQDSTIAPAPSASCHSHPIHPQLHPWQQWAMFPLPALPFTGLISGRCDTCIQLGALGSGFAHAAARLEDSPTFL